jgi:hypothetical protein
VTASTSSASILYPTTSSTTTSTYVTGNTDILSTILSNPTILGLLAVGVVGIIVVGGKK